MKRRSIRLALALLIAGGVTALEAKSPKERYAGWHMHTTVQATAPDGKMCPHLETKRPKERLAGWYMRTTVRVTAPDGKIYAHDSAGVFGELRQSRNGKDRHDIPSYGPATLQIVFPHYRWKEGDAGDYWSDYRHYSRVQSYKRRVWTFQVKNQKGVDLSQAEFRLFLDDAIKVYSTLKNGRVVYKEKGRAPRIKRRFTLVDVDEHRTYSPEELKDVVFEMGGRHTRTFRWVRGRVRARDFRLLKTQ